MGGKLDPGPARRMGTTRIARAHAIRCELNLGHAWNHLGDANGYEEWIGACLAFVENVRAADVGAQRQRRGAGPGPKSKNFIRDRIVCSEG